jgi:glycosidase
MVSHVVALLILGKFIPLDEDNERIYAWVRDDPTIQQKLLIVLNLARGKDGRGEEVTFSIPNSVDTSSAKLLITNGNEKDTSIIGDLKLTPWEGRVYLL